MEKITYHCEIITPMFIGNAIPGQVELRPPAIKAALRFWWRALHGNLSINDLLSKENEVFGSSDEKFGKSKLIITASNTIKSTSNKFPLQTVKRKIQKTQKPQMGAKDINILEYLAFGAVDRGEYKQYFAPGENFNIHITYPSGFDITEIENAFFFSSIFGGLGSKARNGFGRFNISGLSEKTINNILKPLKTGSLSDFTSFSTDISLYGLDSKFYWNETLAELGRIYLSSRVNFHNGVAKTLNGLEDEHCYNLRPFIASPLLENKNTHLPKYNGTTVQKLQRHSKNHFFGIAKNSSGCEGYILHLPYKYLAGSERELGITSADIAVLQSNYQSASDKFNTNLIKNGLKKIIV